ncbi:podocalyxin isoform 2-T2 [Vipera latastei]
MPSAASYLASRAARLSRAPGSGQVGGGAARGKPQETFFRFLSPSRSEEVEKAGRQKRRTRISPAGRCLARRPVRTGSALAMLRGDLPALRWALQWLLLAGLLVSPPCGGVAADSSPTPPPPPPPLPPSVTVPSVTADSASHKTLGKVTTSSLTSALKAPTSKPSAPPTSPTSPVVAEPPKIPTAGTSLNATTPSLPTKRGDTTTPVAVIVPSATASRAPTLAPELTATNSTSSRGTAAKDPTSISGPSTLTFSPPLPSSAKPVRSTAKSPGALFIPTKTSAAPGVVSHPTTLATATPGKSGTTSKDKEASALPTSPNTLLANTTPRSAGAPRSSTLPFSTSRSLPYPERKTTPLTLSEGTTIPQEPDVPSPSSRGNLTSLGGQAKMVCENKMPPKEKVIILTLNESRPCNSLEGSPLKEALAEVLCKALKTDYDQNRDDCTIWLASDREDLKRVAVVKASVQTHSVDEKLSEALATKRAELEKLGVNNITYGGQVLDAEFKDHLSLPLIITIICMAASLLLVAAIYGCCHQRISQRKDQRLTEELHTIENGYHDNPTLEVMETLSDMQEKKVNLNGELGDSWIVPMDSLTKDDLDEEEDTHL